MTRKYRIKKRKILSNIKTKIHKRTIKMKGGAHLILKEAGGSLIGGLMTMFKYGFVSIVTAPIYLIALLANLPLNTPNNVSGKRLNEVKSGIIHNQLYKYLFYGYNLKDLKEEKYRFPEGKHYKLQGNKVFVECDDCKRKNPTENIPENEEDKEDKEILKGGGIDVKKDMKKILGISGISDLLGLLDKKEKMQSILMNFFDYLNNLQMTDIERRELIHKLITNIHNKDSIIKCLIIFNTLFKDDDKCNILKKEIDNNATKDNSTYMERPTISRIPNPFMVPGQSKLDLKKSIKCITGHLLYKEFGPETLTQDCLPKCPKCTLRSSLGTLAATYGSSITQLMKGNNKDIDLFSEIFFNIFNNNFSYPGTDDNLKMKDIKDNFIKSLSNLPEYSIFGSWKMYPKNVDMTKLQPIIIDTKFDVKTSSIISDIFGKKVIDKDKEREIYKKIYGEDVIEKFRVLLCRYNIIDELKKRYISLSFENYYFLVENILNYPKDNNHKNAYLTWCNKFLSQLYTIHGINVENKMIDPKFSFTEKEMNDLILNSSNSLVTEYKSKMTKL
jgi:hypothetical protein